LGSQGIAVAHAEGAGTAYISNERGNTVSVIDLGSGKAVATWQVGARPRGIALSRDGGKSSSRSETTMPSKCAIARPAR
jgi:YVTN family beta-propeller protein